MRILIQQRIPSRTQAVQFPAIYIYSYKQLTLLVLFYFCDELDYLSTDAAHV